MLLTWILTLCLAGFVSFPLLPALLDAIPRTLLPGTATAVRSGDDDASASKPRSRTPAARKGESGNRGPKADTAKDNARGTKGRGTAANRSQAKRLESEEADQPQTDDPTPSRIPMSDANEASSDASPSPDPSVDSADRFDGSADSPQSPVAAIDSPGSGLNETMDESIGASPEVELASREVEPLPASVPTTTTQQTAIPRVFRQISLSVEQQEQVLGLSRRFTAPLEELRSQLDELETEYELELQNLLTPAQQRQVRQMQRLREE